MSKEFEIAFRDLVLRRLSGLLSGCPPIDTRPQARAKLGMQELMDPARTRKSFGRGAPQADRARLGVGWPRRASALGHERLDLLGMAHERDHDGNAAEEEDALE